MTTKPQSLLGQEPAENEHIHGESLESSPLSVSASEMRQFHRLHDLLERGGEGEKILQARALILCGLPLLRTARPVVHRVARVAPDTTLTVTYSTRDEAVPLPFGSDRALASWLQTQAILHRRSGGVVSFRHITEFFSAFEIEACGVQYQRFRERLARLESLAISLRIEAPASVARLNLHFIRRSVARRVPSLSPADFTGLLQDDDHCYGIQLDPAFFSYLVEHAVPLPLPLMRLFLNEPKAWDFTSFVLYRCYIARSRSVVPFDDLRAQLGSTDQYPRRLKMSLGKVLRKIRVAFPDCPAHFLPGQLGLSVEPWRPGRGRD